jgi:predicted neutral ceramidase superfamily lipid hydrolase
LRIFCHRWTERHSGWVNRVSLWWIILISLFLFTLVFAPYHPLLIYLLTVPVIWCVLFLCGTERERTPSHFLRMQAAYYRQSGLLFYVLQIAMIRVVDLSVKGMGIDSSLIWQWYRPLLIYRILSLLSGRIAKIRYCLVKRSASV